MMRPEDVPAEMVEKAYRARADYMRGEPIGDLEWQAVWSTIEADSMRHALAAVLLDIQAQALREAALELNLPGSTATGYYASEQVAGYNDADRDAEAWLIDRADRLTTKTEGTTT